MSTHEGLFHSSFQRASNTKLDGVGFADAFFANLRQSSSEVAARIVFSDTESFRSALMLSIVHLSSYAAKGESSSTLEAIARRQSRLGRNIAPHLYDHYLSAVLETARRYDQEFAPDVEEAWRTTLLPGLEHMKRSY